MGKVKSFLILFVLLYAIPFLSSCSNDDEDGSIRSGSTNLVGTWAEIYSTSDGEQEAYYIYIIKEDCSIAALGFHHYKYDDGYLIDTYNYTQQELEKYLEEASANKTYRCSFSNNTFYWEGDAMAKITVIDSETVKMESVHLGNATLKKIKRIVGKADFNFGGFYDYSVSLVGKWMGVDMEENSDGTHNVRWLFEVDEYGRLSTRQIEGIYLKNDFGNGIIKSPLSQEELDYKLKSDATVYKYCQRKDFGLFCDDELLATIKAKDFNEFQMDSKKWGNLRLIRYDDGDVQIVSSQNFDFMFTPHSGGNPVSLVGTWIFFDENTSMTTPSEKLIFTLSSDGKACLYRMYGTYNNNTFKTTLSDFYDIIHNEYDNCQRKGDGLYYYQYMYEQHWNELLLLTAECIDSDHFNIVWQSYDFYIAERVNNIMWEYDFGNSGYTPDAPLSVGEAIAKCKEFGSTASESSFYVKGIISSINEVSLSYGNATFNISDNGKDTSESVVTAYHTYAPDNKKFESESQIKVGDVVILCGKLVNYRDNAPELLQGYIYSLSSGSSPIDFGTHGDGTTR